MHLESQAAVLVARFLLCRLPGVGAGREVGSQHAQILGVVHDGVGFATSRERPLCLDVDRGVAIIRQRQELEAPPVARSGSGRAVVGRVFHRVATRIDARAHEVVRE